MSKLTSLLNHRKKPYIHLCFIYTQILHIAWIAYFNVKGSQVSIGYYGFHQVASSKQELVKSSKEQVISKIVCPNVIKQVLKGKAMWKEYTLIK